MLKLTLLDVILVPVYAIVISLCLRLLSKQLKQSQQLSLYFFRGLRIKLLFGVLFGLFSIFLLPGDTEMYYTAGLDFKKIIFEKSENLRFMTGPAQDFGNYYEINGFRPENYGYVSADSNLMAVKIVALFSLISFDSYLVISMFFSLFSFVGLWFMFKCFYRIYPTYYKAIFMVFFLIPSVLFWGSGILKDTLCLGFLGIGFYNSYLFLFEKRYQIKILVALLFSFYCLYVLKSYMAYAFIPSFLFWYALKTIGSIENKALKTTLIVAPILLIVLYLSFGNLDNYVSENSVEAVAENILTTQKNYIATTPDDGALLDYGEIVPTVNGILRIAPQALVASLFRPFLWEAKKITSLIAAIEGTFLFCFTIFVFFRRGFLYSLKTIASDSTVLFCFLYSIVFATAIGLNCFNLGTLVRYKIPCLPFYILSLVLIIKKEKAVKPMPALEDEMKFQQLNITKTS